MKTISKEQAYAKMTFICATWGFSFVVSKYAMQQGFTEFTLAFVRYIFVCMIMLPILQKQEGLHLPEKKDRPAIILSGVTGVTLYFICEYMGVMRTTVVNASLVLAAIPVLSILYGALRGRVYRPACWAGVFISMVGVFFVVYFGAASESESVRGQVLLGNLLLLGASLCWVIYIELSNKLLRKYTSLNLTAWQALVGLIALAPTALLDMPRWQPISLGGIASALFLALICSGLCYFWYAQSIIALSPIQAAIFVNVNPIVAVLAGVLLLGEAVVGMQLIGGAMIVGSILLVNVGMR